MSFQPRCLATGIGSLPHTNDARALELVKSALPEIPYVPQFPSLSWHEGMLVQYSEGLPGCVLDEEHEKLHLDTIEQGPIELESYYTRVIEDDPELFAVSGDYWRAMAGLERPQHGYLRLNGRIWQDGHRFTPPHRRPFGYVFQEPSLFPHLSVLKNLEFGLRRTSRAERRVGFDELRRILETARYPSRSPRENLADVEAQVAANQTGVRLLLRLIESQGAEAVLAYMRHIQDAARRLMEHRKFKKRLDELLDELLRELHYELLHEALHEAGHRLLHTFQSLPLTLDDTRCSFLNRDLLLQVSLFASEIPWPYQNTR